MLVKTEGIVMYGRVSVVGDSMLLNCTGGHALSRLCSERKGPMKRRSFLKGAGVVTVVVAGGGVWRAYDKGVFSVGEGPAYEPWKDWSKDSNQGPLALARAAILAASPHNTQPWLFKVANSSIELYIDTQRHVGGSTPHRGQ